MGQRIRIGVVATGTRIDEALAERVRALAADAFLDQAPEIVFHPQCFLSAGHFAGDDAARATAFLDVANDPKFDALWVARGGYGACRMAEHVLANYHESARAKTYLGYSDAAALLAGLYKLGFPNIVHGPMPIDITREGGEAAVKRALAYLIERAPESLEMTVMAGGKFAAFNIMILHSILGTALEPDLSDHVIMLEELNEYLYRIDRALFHIFASPNVRRARGIKLGRISNVPENDKPFGATAEEMIKYWCGRTGVPYLGRADIGHDVENKVVPFGMLKR
ncbi:MAG: LD-carboxypeptidase [Proteobacteria bacterium]|nr:LD-carboxypeptidase [Pseudomonadota bacterium]